MAQVLQGDRIGKEASVTVGCAAAIYSPDGKKLLLIRRKDNGRWCMPSGHMEAGESLSEACAREVEEEVGLEVAVAGLIGVYSSPDRIIEYDGESRQQPVTLCLRVTVRDGEPQLSGETTEWGYFDEAEAANLELMEDQVQPIADAFTGRDAAFIR